MESKKLDNSWQKTLIITGIFFIVSAGYAIIRYHFFKALSWSQFPAFIFNKIISLTALITLATAYFLGPLGYFLQKNWQKMRKNFGLLGFALAVAHILFSFPLFTPAYFETLFYQKKLNFYGNLTLFLGVWAFVFFAIIAICSIPSIAKSMLPSQWLKVQRLGYVGLFLVMGHVLARGNIMWLESQMWPGGLLPMSMIAFIIAAIAIIARVAMALAKKLLNK